MLIASPVIGLRPMRAARCFFSTFTRPGISTASFLTMKGEDARALKAARKGVEIDPDSPLAQNNLAVALFFSRDFKSSKEHMEKARELGYSVDPNFVNRLNQELA